MAFTLSIDLAQASFLDLERFTATVRAACSDDAAADMHLTGTTLTVTVTGNGRPWTPPKNNTTDQTRDTDPLTNAANMFGQRMKDSVNAAIVDDFVGFFKDRIAGAVGAFDKAAKEFNPDSLFTTTNTDHPEQSPAETTDDWGDKDFWEKHRQESKGTSTESSSQYDEAWSEFKKWVRDNRTQNQSDDDFPPINTDEVKDHFKRFLADLIGEDSPNGRHVQHPDNKTDDQGDDNNPTDFNDTDH